MFTYLKLVTSNCFTFRLQAKNLSTLNALVTCTHLGGVGPVRGLLVFGLKGAQFP